jgi:hypothetical protein
MEAKRTKQQVIDWLKAAEKRQQDWQQEVKKRWAEKCHSGVRILCDCLKVS